MPTPLKNEEMVAPVTENIRTQEGEIPQVYESNSKLL